MYSAASSLHKTWPLLLATGLLVLAVPLLIWLYVIRPPAMLGQWARAYHFEIVQCRRRWLFKGPYWWYHHCVVYRVTARNHKGFERTGWVCRGSLTLGTWVNSVNVTWDDKNPA